MFLLWRNAIIHLLRRRAGLSRGSTVTARERVAAVEKLLEETAAAHHEAFADVDGVDTDWSLWYADYLAQRLGAITRFAGHRSEIVHWLNKLDKEYRESDSKVPWARAYARRIAAL